MFLGYLLAILVGISLGLIGSGGSILTLPILVYIMDVDPLAATAYSLFIVGIAALAGGIRNAMHKTVHFPTVLAFGLPSIAAVYSTRKWLLPLIPDTLLSIGNFTLTKAIALMLMFAIVMIMASLSMIRSGRRNIEPAVNASGIRARFIMLLRGIQVGILTGLLGAGGGFLVIPVLVLQAGMNMSSAIGTSLFIVALNSLFGFTQEWISGFPMNWTLIAVFSASALIGVIIGSSLSAKVSSTKLKSAFGWFVLVIGCYILLKELLLR
jgi:uncharacterized membrane protein YfcA